MVLLPKVDSSLATNSPRPNIMKNDRYNFLIFFIALCSVAQNGRKAFLVVHLPSLFLYHVKTSENQTFSNFFKAYRKRLNRMKGLRTFS